MKATGTGPDNYLTHIIDACLLVNEPVRRSGKNKQELKRVQKEAGRLPALVPKRMMDQRWNFLLPVFARTVTLFPFLSMMSIDEMYFKVSRQ